MKHHGLTKRRGYTLVEVLIALALLMAGIIAIVQLFPAIFEAHREAELTGAAALLAQQKAEEIRRDDDRLFALINEIENLTGETTPVTWSVDPRLAYSYSGLSAYSDTDTPGDPRDDTGVARIIVRMSAEYNPDQPVLYELRFDR